MADRHPAPRRVQLLDGGAATAPDALDGLTSALAMHPSFTPMLDGGTWDPAVAHREGVDLVVVGGPAAERAGLIAAILDDGFDVLARPTSDLFLPSGEPGPGAARLLPFHTDRYAPALRSAATALAAGRIGLPWNVQLDLLLSGTGRPKSAEELIEHAGGPVDAVLQLLRLPARRVYVPTGPQTGEGTVTIQIDHDHDVLSTIVVGAVGSVPGDDGFGTPVIRNRYRISGSHGELLIDALRPRVRVSRPQGRTSRWNGPSALSGLLDAIVAGRTPALAEVRAVQQVLDAARRSIRERGPVQVGDRVAGA